MVGGESQNTRGRLELACFIEIMEDKIEARERVGASLPKSSEKGLATATSLVVERNSKTPASSFLK